MSLAVAGRIARRELRGGIRGFRVFLVCLILGVAAIAAVGSVRESIRAGLAREGAVLLGGDAELELTYQFADAKQRAWMESRATRVSETVDFRSMATYGQGDTAQRGLTQVKGVDGAYPLLGTVGLDPAMPISKALAITDGLPGAVMAPLLIDRLGMKVGDTFRLGTQTFRLNATLTREPDDARGGFTFGPRTLVRTEDLAQSGLIQPGTLFETQYRLLLPKGADFAALQARAAKDLPGARWRDSRQGAPGVERFVSQLGSFLVLVGIAGLAVGGVGISAAVRAYLETKTPVIATLKTLGAENRTIFQIYFIQIGVLTLTGLVLGVALGAALPNVFAPLIQSALPVPAVFGIHPFPLAEAALYGALTALIFTLWPLARTEEVRAAALFRDVVGRARLLPRKTWIGLTLLLLAALVGSAAALSGLVLLTLWSALGVGAAFVFLVLVSEGVRRLARRAARSRRLRGHSVIRLAMGAIGGPGSEAMSVVLSLGLGLAVLAAVGQIDANLKDAIQRDLPEVAPTFFVLDIQPDQMPGFQTMLDNNPDVSRVDSAPMLRGIVTRINGRPAEEVAGQHWVLRGDRGVTYSARPPKGTQITAGTWWPEDYNGPPQVSFGAEQAAELGLKMGDTITVNILGRDITATITSFRNVDFSTAGIGFVMSMDPAALSAAPHSFIATIYAKPEAAAPILRQLATAFPNITAINVRDAIERVSGLLTGIASAITYGALATLVTGGFVLIGAAAAGENARVYEAAVLKTLGASRRTILASFALRSALLGAAAGLVAIAAGGIAGWGVMHFVMETAYSFEPVSAVAIVSGGVVATLLAGLAFAWGPLSARPGRVLRARE